MDTSFIGFHYDIARGTYLKPDIFCRALKLAAESGYTHFLPYLENMIRLPSMERACPSCAYTAEDWKRFEAVAKDAGIELVPHFNVIGHTESIAPAYPELCYEDTEINHLDLDVEKEVTCEWIRHCLGEFCDFSNSQYFLIGGDEWQTPKHLLARVDFDVAKTWVDQINSAVKFLVEHNRQPIVWHDMLIHYPEILSQLSRQAVIAFWFYDYDSDYAALQMFKKHGFRTLMASAVFGGSIPTLANRSINSLRQAKKAVTQHGVDGMIVTSWEHCRWELELYNIPMAAKVIRGKKPSVLISETLSLYNAWMKISKDSVFFTRWKQELEYRLNQVEWNEAPETRSYLLTILKGDTENNIASYVKYHYPLGRGYENISKVPTQSQCSVEKPKTSDIHPAFGLQVLHDNQLGDILCFFNGSESFNVYPKFGASLQSWQWDGNMIVKDFMANFIKSDMPSPGGYRSYTAVGGLRLIWALGTHSNPCILWQHPWKWEIVERTNDKITVKMELELVHGSFTIHITTEKGKPGFNYEASCVNRLEYAYGAFNFNLPLSSNVLDLTDMKFVWNKDGKTQATSICEQRDSAFWIPAHGELIISCPSWAMYVDAAPEQTAGYFIDWSSTQVTPDLHGIYRSIRVGEETITSWHFSPGHPWSE